MNQSKKNSKKADIILFDKYLLFAVIMLMLIGLLMVTSASMAISERQFNQPFHYLVHQAVFLILGLLVAGIVIRIEMKFWYKVSSLLLMFGIFLLVLVLVPGIGREVNGSMRWIGFGPLGLQVSEFVKLAVIIYLAGYLVRHQEEIQIRLRGFIKAMCLLGIVSILLLLEPDFGATVVIMITALSMMYLSGMKLWHFGVLLVLVALALALLAVSSPYRLLRLTTFLNPWAHAFNSGYQLTQSLIAFGRGGLFGVGLGGSIQKLFYLPEAHTDFLFAVLGEELGLVWYFIYYWFIYHVSWSCFVYWSKSATCYSKLFCLFSLWYWNLVGHTGGCKYGCKYRFIADQRLNLTFFKLWW